MIVKAAVLAAGDSTRMLPLSANVPKHLLPVAGEPLIFHTLRGLRSAGIRETLVVHGYHGEEIQKAIDSRDWTPMKISYAFQKERKGTAHAASHAREFAHNEPIILMYGDLMVGPDTFPGLMTSYGKGKLDTILSVTPVDDPSSYGVVTVDGDRATGLVEKPAPGQNSSNLVNAGIYVAGPKIWDAIEKTGQSSRGEYEITDSIMMLMKQRNVGVYQLPSWWLDIGKPWDLLKANELVLNTAVRRIEGDIEDGAVIKGNVIVERGATIRSGAYIEGPAFIGSGCVIGPNCYIRASTSLCSGVRIGNAVEVKNSIIMEETHIGHLSYVGDSIIGRKSNFGAGTITANLRHDDQSVRVTVKNQRISSGRRKMGAIIGDNVKTGIGTLLSPGVVIHQDARIGIGVIVDRDVPPGVLVVADETKRIIHLKPDR
jgi:bifunctional UDP-N-acetylglucosamine pyrophosphorylase/glucosamine-1-phosphate N-acetyltransferase